MLGEVLGEVLREVLGEVQGDVLGEVQGDVLRGDLLQCHWLVHDHISGLMTRKFLVTQSVAYIENVPA